MFPTLFGLKYIPKFIGNIIVWIKEDTISEMGAGNRMKLIIPVQANLICETQFLGY